MRALGPVLFLLVLNGCASRDAPSTKGDASPTLETSAEDASEQQDSAEGLDTKLEPDTAVLDTAVLAD